jgi:hypothetical protein
MGIPLDPRFWKMVFAQIAKMINIRSEEGKVRESRDYTWGGYLRNPFKKR